MARRDFLRKLVSIGGGVVTAGIVGVPAIATLISPVLQHRDRVDWQPLGKLSDFPVGKVTKAVIGMSRRDWAGSVREQAVYVWRRTDDGVVVFSRSCTDVGCPVTHDPGSRCYFCPCHGGIFSPEGEPMAGPPPRPLYRYATRLRESGVLEIDLRSVPPMV